ncbi:MAG: transporter substrate-binding domain-containing protein [Pseudomonadota bacterium]
MSYRAKHSRTEPTEIGFIFSQSGVTSLIEQSQRQAALLAVDEVNDAGGVLGQELVVADSDPGSDPVRFRAEAGRLLDKKVAALFGCYMSSTRKAVLPLVEQRRSLLFYPTLYEGFEYSSSCIYSGAAPNQNARALADYLTECYGQRYFFVGSNYVFPYETNRIMRDLLSNRGAQVVDEVYIPLKPQPEDIQRVITMIRSAGPVVIFSTVVGDGAVEFYRAYHAAGFDRKVQPISSLTFGEPEIRAVGREASVGHVKSAPYFSVLSNAANRNFMTAYRTKFGDDVPISAEAEAAYFQVRLYAEAVNRAGDTSVEAVLRTLPTFTFEAPQGPVRIDGRTHHTYLWPRIAVVREHGGFEVVRESASPVAPEPYLVEHDEPGQLYLGPLPSGGARL